HSAGDQVLKEFVRKISNLIRTNLDWIGRYGGEEFLVVLPETDIDGACFLAERLRKIISEMVIPMNGKDISITASFGVAELNHEMTNPEHAYEEVLNEVDQYLYQAKNGGRNRVVGSMGEYI
ncbi:MAG: GGDEF domain-containing protein, partial [Deltaproteobacteria bacterium]|nr:GGDEF domain-containing protein [Deltaproteobacteria bacterium]